MEAITCRFLDQPRVFWKAKPWVAVWRRPLVRSARCDRGDSGRRCPSWATVAAGRCQDHAPC